MSPRGSLERTTPCAACSLSPVIRHLPESKRMSRLPADRFGGSSRGSLSADVDSQGSVRRTRTTVRHNYPGTSVLGPCSGGDIFSSAVQHSKQPAVVLPLYHLPPRGGGGVQPLARTLALLLSLCGNLSLPRAQQDEYQTRRDNRRHTGFQRRHAVKKRRRRKSPPSRPAAQNSNHLWLCQ